MRLSAVIPTIGAVPGLLIGLLDVLAADEIPTVVYDNGCSPTVRAALDDHPGATVHDAAGMGLYAMWDHGVTHASADYVAVLNDDIELLPGSLPLLADALDADERLDLVSADYDHRIERGLAPDAVQYTVGSYRRGGACGWCFVIRRATYPEVGDGYTWWAGDDELIERITSAGRRTGIYRGVPVDHIGEASARHRDWTNPAKHQDLATFTARWGL